MSLQSSVCESLKQNIESTSKFPLRTNQNTKTKHTTTKKKTSNAVNVCTHRANVAAAVVVVVVGEQPTSYAFDPFIYYTICTQTPHIVVRLPNNRWHCPLHSYSNYSVECNHLRKHFLPFGRFCFNHQIISNRIFFRVFHLNRCCFVSKMCLSIY